MSQMPNQRGEKNNSKIYPKRKKGNKSKDYRNGTIENKECFLKTKSCFIEKANKIDKILTSIIKN